MVLGGAGLVGTAVARRLALLKAQWRPSKIIVASLTEDEAVDTVSHLTREQDERTQYIPHQQGQKQVEFIPEWGDVFVRSEFAHLSRRELLQHSNARQALLSDLYDSLDAAYEQSHLVSLLRKHRPNVLIDSVNTATGLSYQNVFDTASRLRQALAEPNDSSTHNSIFSDSSTGIHPSNETTERLLLSQSVPTLTRHIQILSQVAQEYGMESYLKIGTTGTGGMGLNLPFTHSESKPSNLILAKNEAAFGHTGLLYLWSQTPGAPRVLEIIPAAGVGYRRVQVHAVKDRYGNEFIRKPRLLELQVGDGTVLNVREDESNYAKLSKMITVGVDMGENGLFTADEFLTLSAAGSMELITPEEIAEVCVQELLGIGTGHNVLASIRGSVLAPGYRAGMMRHAADEHLSDLEKLSTDTTMPSIALGRLGPPLLSKILMEAHILKLKYDGPDGLQQLSECDPVGLSRELSAQVQQAMQSESVKMVGSVPSMTSLSYIASTIGVPVLVNNNLMLRGPNITVPEPVGYDSLFALSSQELLDGYAKSGWIDLRSSNLQVWKERACHILSEPPVSAENTTVLTGLHYQSGSKEVNASALASWIIAGEVHGQRDLNSVSELE
jgi:hypothetical protein